MRILGAAGLTTREACAHTVHNITACPDAGVSPDETFDTTPWLVAYARNMRRNPICQRLPRKFKTSFSNSGADNAGSNFHDLGFIARERTGANGQKEYGFELRVGGGTSTMPRLADTVWEFATLEDGEYIRVSEAILRIFDRDTNRYGKMFPSGRVRWGEAEK
jgi:sulfite reductase beta subunit-like hemoprotein